MGLSLFTKLITTSRRIQASGYNWSKQLDGSSNILGSIEKNENNFELNIKEPKVKDVRLMAKSVYHTIYVLNNGQVFVSGMNKWGECGLQGSIANYSDYKFELEENNFFEDKLIKKVVCGGYSTYVLTYDNRLYVCGMNRYGQIKLPNLTPPCYQFTEITFGNNISNIENIEAGGYHLFVRTTEGNNYVIGKNDHGQLGKASLGNEGYLDNRNYKIISCGGDFTYLLRDDNKLFVCGYNGYGQLGLGSEDNNVHYMTELTSSNLGFNPANIEQIECGANHVLIRLKDKTVYGCGDSQYGQLGTGKSEIKNSFIKLDISNVSYITTDAYSSIFQISTIILKGCGHNRFGELGLGDNINRLKITDLLYTNIWLDNLRDEIISLPNFDEYKDIFAADCYFMYEADNCIIYLDNELNLITRSKTDGKLLDIWYFWINKGNIYYSSNYYEVFNTITDKRINDYEVFQAYANIINNGDNNIRFFINNHLYKYNTENKELKEEYVSTNMINWCYSKWVTDNNKIINVETGKLMNIDKDLMSCISESQLWCLSDEYEEKYFDVIFYNNNTKLFYYCKFDINTDKFIVVKQDLSSEKDTYNAKIQAMCYCRGRLYIGTRTGKIYCNYDREDNKFHFLKKFSSEIIFLTIKYNSSYLNRDLIIDDHGRYLIICFTDGRYERYPLYKIPEVTMKIDDTNFVDDKVYHHISFRLHNIDKYPSYDNFTYGMKFLAFNNWNEKYYEFNNLDQDTGICSDLLEFNRLDLQDPYTNIKLNYLYGNNTKGSIMIKTYNIKINLLFFYNNKINLNISNYSSEPQLITIERVNPATNKIEDLESFILSNEENHIFWYSKEYSYENLQCINIRATSTNEKRKDITCLIAENIFIKDIDFNDTVRKYNNENDILANFTDMYNHIYEKCVLDNVAEEYIVHLLQYLSSKSYEKVLPLKETVELDDNQQLDIKGNSNLFLQNNKKHYIMPLNPKDILKSVRYRTNVFINGIKIPYNDVYNLLDMKDGSLNTYFTTNSNKEEVIEMRDNPVIDVSLYKESLIKDEELIHKIYIKTYDISANLINGSYLFTIDKDFNDKLDLSYISLHVKFLHGSFFSRIELSDYELEIVERNLGTTKFKLCIRNEVLAKLGNEIHIMINDLDNKNQFIFKDNKKKTSTKYRNYFLPLITLNKNGSIYNYYTGKSENVEVFVDGLTLTPYVDYKVMNFPLHLQIPTLIVFKNPIKSDIKIEVSITKENLLPCITSKYESFKNDKIHENKDILSFKDGYYSTLNTNYIPLLNTTFDLYTDGIKIPIKNSFDKIYQTVCNIRGEHQNYIRFLLNDEPFVRFLILLLRLKLKKDNSSFKSNPNFQDLDGHIESNSIRPTKKISAIFEDKNDYDGLLFFLFEVYDNYLINEEDVIIDCNDNLQLNMDVVVKLDQNRRYTLPYINEDIEFNCNKDYNIKNFNNNIV